MPAWARDEKEAREQIARAAEAALPSCEGAKHGRRPQPRRIFWAAMYGGYDQDQLEALLFEISDIVHVFIVVEGDYSLQGDYRPRTLPALLEDGGRFARYRQKLVVHPFSQPEPEICSTQNWVCSERQRQALLTGAVNAGLSRDTDLLVVADGDEIMSRETTTFLAHCNLGPTPIVVPMSTFFYRLDLEFYTHTDLIVAPAEFFLDAKESLQHFRRLSPKPFPHMYPYSGNGWHASFFGGPYMVRQKVLSYMHAEWSKPPYTEVGFIKKGMWEGLDPFRRGPLFGMPTKPPRIVGTQRIYDCWEDSLGLGCRSEKEVNELLNPRVDCWGRFLNAALAEHSGVNAVNASKTKLREQGEGCLAAGEPSRYLLYRVNLGAYASSFSWRRDVRQLADHLMEARRQLSGDRPRGRADAWGICVPALCLAEGTEALLKLAHRYFSRMVLPQQVTIGQVEASTWEALPLWGPEHVIFEMLPPAASHRPELLRVQSGPIPGSPGGRRLVLGFLDEEPSSEFQLQEALHIFLGSLRQAQVAAVVAVIVDGAAAASACEALQNAYGAECIRAEDLKCSQVPGQEGMAGVARHPQGAGASTLAWHCWKVYLSKVALGVEEVLLAPVTDTLFQADPFEGLHMPGRTGNSGGNGDTGLVLPAETVDAVLGDLRWYQSGCAACVDGGRPGWPSCKEAAEFPALHGGLLLGLRAPVLGLLSSLATSLRRAGPGCGAGALLNALAWGGHLRPGLRAAVPAAETGLLCALGSAPFIDVGAAGDVLNRAGQRCAVARQLSPFPQLRRLARLAVPGGRRRGPAPELPLRAKAETEVGARTHHRRPVAGAEAGRGPEVRVLDMR